MSLGMSLEDTMQVSLNIGGLHLREFKKRCVVMNLVVPVSVPFIRHHIFHVPRLSRGTHSFR